MSTWLKQKPIKNRWQPLPYQIALLPIEFLARGTLNKLLPGVQNNISIASSVYLEQGDLLKPKSAILFFVTQRPWSSPRAFSYDNRFTSETAT
jgi:hypothetical protein